jgi:sensor histidine kinase YesM
MMTLKKRFYITGSITVPLIILSIIYRNAQSELPIYLFLLTSGVIFYMSFFYLLETGKLKRSNTNRIYRNISYAIVIILLVFGIILANQVDDSKASFWVINYNLWFADILRFILWGFVFYLVFSWFFEQWKIIQTIKSKKVKAELALLKNQINPHFFFNTLNNLYSLIKSDPDTAQEYVLKLSDMMRFTIYKGKEEMVTLDEEISYLSNFIELQTARYHKKIAIDFKESIENPGTKVPPLLFIILLENAFKHGVESLIDNAFINIELKESETGIVFSIMNNFDSEELSKTPGIGLENLKDRLQLLYPNAHNFTSKTDGNTYLATLELIKK